MSRYQAVGTKVVDKKDDSSFVRTVTTNGALKIAERMNSMEFMLDRFAQNAIMASISPDEKKPQLDVGIVFVSEDEEEEPWEDHEEDLGQMNSNDLEYAVVQWSHDKGIMGNSSLEAQTLKAVSEIGELADSVIKGEDLRDHIGDIVVCLINVAAMSGTSVHESLHLAYNEIKDRTGYMTEGGAFVKD